MNNTPWSRREFLEFGAAAGASLAAKPLTFRPLAPSDTVRFGMVGVGMQGNGLLGTSIGLPGVTCAGAADLYDGRHTLAKEIAGASLPTTREYRRLLDDKNIDCIVAAVPDHWHRKIVVDAGYGPGFKYFSHRLGHGLGMDGHEWPYLVKNNMFGWNAALTAQPGMVFSDEPGIYIPGEFGVRLEDDMYITSDGAKLFTQQSGSLENPF